jgi:hypothetical protein
MGIDEGLLYPSDFIACAKALSDFKQAAAKLISRESNSLSLENARKIIEQWLVGDSGDGAYTALLNDPDLQVLTKCSADYYHKHWKRFARCRPTDENLEALPIGFWTGFVGETDAEDGTGALSFSTLNHIAERLGVHTLQLTEPGTTTMHGRSELNDAMLNVQRTLGSAGKIGPYFNAWSALYARRAFNMWQQNRTTSFVIFSTKEHIFADENSEKRPLESSYVYTTELPRMKTWLDEWRVKQTDEWKNIRAMFVGAKEYPAKEVIRAKFVHIGPSEATLNEAKALIGAGNWDTHFDFVFEHSAHSKGRGSHGSTPVEYFFLIAVAAAFLAIAYGYTAMG